MVANLPGVGKNLHGHFNTPMFVSIDPPLSVTADKIQSFSEIWKYLKNGEGFLSYLPMMGVAHTNENIAFILFGMGSTDEAALRAIANFKPETFRSLFPLYHNSSQEGFVFLSSCLQPKSRGTITLASNNHQTHPKINPNYLSQYDDIKCLQKAIRLSKEIIESPPFKKLNAKIHWPKLNQCELFDLLSDEYLECWIRVGSLTGYHPGGTCKMGNDDSSVVNENLRFVIFIIKYCSIKKNSWFFRVKGIRGLRIIDASIMPSALTHFPNSALIAIADRAVSLILNKRHGD